MVNSLSWSLSLVCHHVYFISSPWSTWELTVSWLGKWRSWCLRKSPATGIYQYLCVTKVASRHGTLDQNLSGLSLGSQNHRMVGFEETSGDHLIQLSCKSRFTYSRLHMITPRQVLNIPREGDSTAPLGSLFQCSITLRMKKFFLVFRWNFLCFSLCPLPFALSLGTTEKSLAPFSWHPPLRHLWAFIRIPESMKSSLSNQQVCKVS